MMLRPHQVILALVVVLAGCTNSGTIVVHNGTESVITDVITTVTSEASPQILHTAAIPPGEERTVAYTINSEYSIALAILTNTGRLNANYGYVIDNWRHPVHQVVIRDSSVTFDGEPIDNVTGGSEAIPSLNRSTPGNEIIPVRRL